MKVLAAVVVLALAIVLYFLVRDRMYPFKSQMYDYFQDDDEEDVK